MNLRWTDAGRAALASAANVGTAALRLTHFAIGDGNGSGGAADDGRAALRSERHRAAIRGTDTTEGRIAFRADFTPDAGYGITEAGVFGTAGDPAGPLTLYLYWTDGGTLAGQAADGAALAVAAVVEFQAAAADVEVTVGGNIEFGEPPDEASETEFGLTRYATDAETDGNSGVRAVTPKGLRAKFGALIARLIGAAATENTVYQLKGKADGTLLVEERTQDTATSAAIAALQGKTAAATTAKKGIVELATSTEGKAGADTSRAMTAKATRDSTANNIASLLESGSSIEQGKRYFLEGLAAGGLKLVLGVACLVVACEGIDDADLLSDPKRVDYDAGNYFGLEPFETTWSTNTQTGTHAAVLRYRLESGTYLFFGAGRTRPGVSGWAANDAAATVSGVAADHQTHSVFPVGFQMSKIVAATGANEIQVTWRERTGSEPGGNFVIAQWPFD